jgi:hypothetical protein
VWAHQKDARQRIAPPGAIHAGTELRCCRTRTSRASARAAAHPRPVTSTTPRVIYSTERGRHQLERAPWRGTRFPGRPGGVSEAASRRGGIECETAARGKLGTEDKPSRADSAIELEEAARHDESNCVQGACHGCMVFGLFVLPSMVRRRRDAAIRRRRGDRGGRRVVAWRDEDNLDDRYRCWIDDGLYFDMDRPDALVSIHSCEIPTPRSTRGATEDGQVWAHRRMGRGESRRGRRSPTTTRFRPTLAEPCGAVARGAGDMIVDEDALSSSAVRALKTA